MLKKDIVDDLIKGVRIVIFKKVDGTIRRMRCTLKADYLPNKETPAQRDDYTVTVWDLDEKDWRRFRIDTLQTIIDDDDVIKPMPSGIILRSAFSAWLKTTNDQGNKLDHLYNQLDSEIRKTDNDVLIYLVYWNNGISGATETEQVKLYKEELRRRGTPYTEEIGEALNAELEPYQ